MEAQQENWEIIKSLFEAALEKDPADWTTFLHQHSSDKHICFEVERPLREHQLAGSFLSHPAIRNLALDDHPPLSGVIGQLFIDRRALYIYSTADNATILVASSRVAELALRIVYVLTRLLLEETILRLTKAATKYFISVSASYMFVGPFV